MGNWKIVANDPMTQFLLFNVQKDRQEKKDLSAKLPEKMEEMKRLLFMTWEDIVEEGPNEWWEAESTKPQKGATVNY